MFLFKFNLKLQKLYRKRFKIINYISSGQKQKKKYTESIPYCKVTRKVLKNKEAKYNIHAPIKSALNISKILKSDRDKINSLETSRTYRTKYSKDNRDDDMHRRIEREREYLSVNWYYQFFLPLRKIEKTIHRKCYDVSELIMVFFVTYLNSYIHG